MKMRSVLVAMVGSGLMLAAGQAAGSANVFWCSSDPPLQVVTPAGNNIMVNNMVSVPFEYRHLASNVAEDAFAAPDGRGGTLVTVHVYVPEGVSQAAVVSSENRFQVASQSEGAGGETITLYLDVPTS